MHVRTVISLKIQRQSGATQMNAVQRKAFTHQLHTFHFYFL